MGTFREKVAISNPAEPSLSIEIEAVVDTGATYTWIPGDKLRRLKVKPTFKRKLKLGTCLGHYRSSR